MLMRDTIIYPLIPGRITPVRHVRPLWAPLPLPRRGNGYLAGKAPGGTATVQGAPVEADIRVLYRPPGGTLGDGTLVAQTRSAQDGTWRVDGLDPALTFDVVARLSGYNDVIVSQVRPAVG